MIYYKILKNFCVWCIDLFGVSVEGVVVGCVDVFDLLC